jgi:hypothetical protein
MTLHFSVFQEVRGTPEKKKDASYENAQVQFYTECSIE